MTDDTTQRPDRDAGASATGTSAGADDGDDGDDAADTPASDGEEDAYRYPSDGPDAGDVAAASAGDDQEIEVPMRLYKTVTVFSTLIAVVAVVVGFVLLDAATLQVSLLRRLVATLLSAVGLGVAEGTLTTLFGVGGLLSIGAGAGVYVLGTRFRAPGMGNAQEERDEPSDNG
ncbi:MAG: hypothetical protein ABEJ79_03555 [Halolamina sp.]